MPAGIAYLNGRFAPLRTLTVSALDRGFLFGDGVYEVVHVYNGKLIDLDGHILRLDTSLEAVGIEWPIAPNVLPLLLEKIIQQNHLQHGALYWQVTRGAASRDFPFPQNARPSLFIMPVFQKNWPEKYFTEGLQVITLPDQRWGRCDIKSINLLAPVLAKQAAKESGVYDAWQVNAEGFITEGTSNNAWIVREDGVLQTHPPTPAILNGITRQRLIDIARSSGLTVEEKPFTVAEAHAAKEAFISSTTTYLFPVVAIDGIPIGTGKPDAIFQQLRTAYVRFCEAVAKVN